MPLPLPVADSAGHAFTRIAYVLFAIVYTLIFATLLGSRSPGRPANQLKATQKIEGEG